jgi:hypothetical protein
MNEEEFLKFAGSVDWRFAKSVPNWPHFYIVESELSDREAFKAARSLIRNSGRDGKFYNLDVRYFDVGGWTYWASPLAKPFESQYMLNRCKTEFGYESLAASGDLPSEGFQESVLALSPILDDPEFKSLVRDAEGSGFSVFNVLGTADYEIRHSNVLGWLLDSSGSHGQGASFAKLLWGQMGEDGGLLGLPFEDYEVDREGGNEDERIDLLLRDRGRRWVIVIENKLFSPETGDQLGRYFHYIEGRYSEVPIRCYFYLTPDGIAPARETDSSNWITVSYGHVKEAVSLLLIQDLDSRVEDFLNQYLEHLERNVLKNAGMTERQRSVLRRHAKTFHSLAFMVEEASVHSQCSDVELNLLRSILAVQHEVEAELFDFTKRLMTHCGYRRYSGQGHWVTIEIPGLRERLVERGLLNDGDPQPIVFTFDSRPRSFRVEVWLYKNKPLFGRSRGRLSRFSEEGPEPNRGDEHLVEVLFRRTILSSVEIIRDGMPELKAKVANYFDAQLAEDLRVCADAITNLLDPLFQCRDQ